MSYSPLSERHFRALLELRCSKTYTDKQLQSVLPTTILMELALTYNKPLRSNIINIHTGDLDAFNIHVESDFTIEVVLSMVQTLPPEFQLEYVNLWDEIEYLMSR